MSSSNNVENISLKQEALLSLKDFSLSLDSKTLLAHINFTVNAKQHIAILGRSGCGKSSLIKVICGVETPFKIAGQIKHYNNPIAYMPQKQAMFPWLTVEQNILFGIKLTNNKKALQSTIANRLKGLLQRMGLCAHAKKYPYQLSGGQRQKVALARTLMIDSPLVAMDEPFSALDTITKRDLQRFFANELQEKAVIFITHDPQEAILLADVILAISHKKIQVFKPKHEKPRFHYSPNDNQDLFLELLKTIKNDQI